MAFRKGHSASHLGVDIEDGQTDDLASLSRLDEGIMLRQLKARYNADVIYTYVGDILVAVNPFKQLPIYDKQHSSKYKRVKLCQFPPHIFAIADAAYTAMIDSTKNQCCVISGESGAGKTESTKLIINQLIELCPTRTTIGLEQRIIQVNPLLEAFGNAQTIMNDNSSRFGKYIQLKFRAGQVLGAKINEYLLEKSRVVQQSEGEENFHVFYYLFAGLSREELQHYQLTTANSYRYLTQGESCLRTRRAECDKMYNNLINAMDLVGFTEEDQNNLFLVLATVLNMGNIEFGEGGNDSSYVKDKGPLQIAANLLGINSDMMESFLTTNESLAAGEVITKNLTKEKAEVARDSMAKALYGRVFSWIINRVNSLLAPQERVQQKDYLEIGILDIFGFEHFEHNSFEQLCINLANEQLQFFFNEHIFKQEQDEYRKEGINWQEIKYVDNLPLLDLFLKKPIGILSLLDEESHFPKGTDLSFIGKLNQNFKKMPHYTPSKDTRNPHFKIHHYAGQVDYDGDGFLEKNRDTLPTGTIELFQISKNDLVHDIFMGTVTRTGTLALKSRKSRNRHTRAKLQAAGKPGRTSGKHGTVKGLTVSGHFKNSLTLLMEKMTASSPHFVRCIKPNTGKMANCFEDEFVQAQLSYTGMLETTRIRREGFAVRPTFEEFVRRFKCLGHLKLASNAQSCRKILESAGIKGFHTGKTKVFLKYYHIDELMDKLEKVHKAATILQKILRGNAARKKVGRLLRKAAEQRQVVSTFLVKVPQNLAGPFKQLQKLCAQDAQRPLDYFRQEQVSSSRPVIQVDDLPPPPPEAKQPANDSDDEEDEEDDFVDELGEIEPVPQTKHGKRFGREGTRAASVRWFKETQARNVAEDNGMFSEWFHGIISRRAAEQLLTSKPIGCFLIRVSESRFGYSLSVRVANRCKHFMIDQTMSGKYIVVGEPKVHTSLKALVAYHQKHPVAEAGDMLTVPCGQDSEQLDYADLMEEDVHISMAGMNLSPMSGLSSSRTSATAASSSRAATFTQTSNRSPVQMRRRVASHARSQAREMNTMSHPSHHMHQTPPLPGRRSVADGPPPFAAPALPPRQGSHSTRPSAYRGQGGTSEQAPPPLPPR